MKASRRSILDIVDHPELDDHEEAGVLDSYFES
jgi:hypothetical protein